MCIGRCRRLRRTGGSARRLVGRAGLAGLQAGPGGRQAASSGSFLEDALLGGQGAQRLHLAAQVGDQFVVMGDDTAVIVRLAAQFPFHAVEPRGEPVQGEICGVQMLFCHDICSCGAELQWLVASELRPAGWHASDLN